MLADMVGSAANAPRQGYSSTSIVWCWLV
jgi:hypothetical protein